MNGGTLRDAVVEIHCDAVRVHSLPVPELVRMPSISRKCACKVWASRFRTNFGVSFSPPPALHVPCSPNCVGAFAERRACASRLGVTRTPAAGSSGPNAWHRRLACAMAGRRLLRHHTQTTFVVASKRASLGHDRSRIPAMASSHGDVRSSPMAYPAVRPLPKLPLPLRPETGPTS